MGLPYPGGLNLDRVAKDGNPKSYKMPHPRVDNAPYDFSFSGLKTAVLNTINIAKQKGEEISVPDLGASYINAVVDCLIENTEKAAKDLGYERIVLAGGVSANSGVRAALSEACADRGFEFYMPEKKLCGDNGAMIACQGSYNFLAGITADESLNAIATLSMEDI